MPKDAETAGPLAHEHIAIREKRHAPRVGEVAGHDANADFMLLGGIDHEGTGT
jgi:hypothetical protein